MKKSKRGCSGYYYFIQDQKRKLYEAGTPYNGNSASTYFAEDWEALSKEEKEKYNARGTSK